MKLNELFRDGMVLAANKPIRVFGTGYGTVSVSFLGMTATVEGTGDAWLVELPAQPYGGPYQMTVDLNGEKLILSDVYVGEVLLLHGQSNLQFKLHESNYPHEHYESDTTLRLFSTRLLTESEPFTPEDGWVCATRENAGDWPAVGYLVGKRLCRELGCAVGVIACYQGASAIRTWLWEETEKALGIHLAQEERHKDSQIAAFSAWNGEGVLYRHQVKRIMPYGLSRVIWYQGESNATPAEGAVYDQLLSELIRQRRADFMDETLSFVVVQIADCLSRAGLGWTRVQEAQERVGRTVAGTVCVISRDVCETDSIHPPTKHLLADRICEAILMDQTEKF